MINGDGSPWKIIDQRLIYDNPWIGVTEYDVINPGGGTGIYGKVHFKNHAIGIVPMDEEGNTWLIGQHRFPVDSYSWEIPEGGGSREIDPVLSAQRELLEETGIKAEEWTLILDMFVSNSVTDERSLVYLARGLSFFASEPEETESLMVKKMPFKTALDMVVAGEITDAISVAALFKVHHLLSNHLI